MFVGMRNCQLRPITAGIYGSLKRASFNNRPMQMYNQKHDSGGINNEANVNGLETVYKTTHCHFGILSNQCLLLKWKCICRSCKCKGRRQSYLKARRRPPSIISLHQTKRPLPMSCFIHALHATS